MKKIFQSLLAVLGLGFATVSALSGPGEVLILGPTVTGGLSSREAQAVVLAGKVPVVVSAAQWQAMTAAEFDSYDAIVLGDPTCTTSAGSVSAAEATALIWGPVIDGNVIIIGTDPTFHFSQGQAAQLIAQGIAFAVAEPGKTGAYITLSCIHHFSGSGTPVHFLDGLNGGGFTVIGASLLPGLNDAHIVASHPALAGLTDAGLSNWFNSVHEGFNTWPVEFEVLAIARDNNGSFTATDGTVGFPYILARGEQLVVISDIDLTPEDDVNPIGTPHTVTATVNQNGVPVVGTTVTFTVIAGPHTGATGTDVTDANGEATFTYVGTAVGKDFIEATFVDSLGRTQRSNRATKDWVAEPPTLTSAAAANRGYYRLTASSTSYPEADLEVWVGDSASGFVAGPFASGTIVRIKRSATTGTGPGQGVASVTVFVNGNGVAHAEDPAGQVSPSVNLRSL